MSDKRERISRGKELSSNKVSNDLTSSESRATLSSESRKIRNISPLGFRVLVSIQKDTNMTDSGLYLPEGSKQASMDSVMGEVLEVARAHDHDTDEGTNVSGIPLGATVLIPKNAGVKVPWDDSLRIIETKDVLAIVHEISVS